MMATRSSSNSNSNINGALKRSGVSSLHLSSLSLSSQSSLSVSSSGSMNASSGMSRGFGSMSSRQAHSDLTLLANAPPSPMSTRAFPSTNDMDVDMTDNWGYFVDTPDF